MSRLRRAEGRAVAVIWAAATLTVASVAAVTRHVDYNPLSVLTSAASQAMVFVAAGTAGALIVLLRHRQAVWPHVVVSATSAALAAEMLISLAKTPFGLGGLDADQSFRSAAMTRYALTALPVDFGYRHHGSFIPPLWFWLAGRVGALLGQPGWEMMRWAQVITAFLVPAAAFFFWRRVAGAAPAALAASLGALAVPDPMKGDEWVSLVIMAPWWLDAFADIRAPRVAPWPAWVHGVIAGLMLSLYTAFFLPAALATLAVAVDALRRNLWRPLLRRWLVLSAAGLAVWSWVWVPALYERLTGPPFRLFQLQWFGDTSPVPAPVEVDLVGLLALTGLLVLAGLAREDRLFRLHTVFAAAVVGLMIVGLLAAAGGHPILVQKTYPMLRYVLVTAAAVGGWHAVRRLGQAYPSWSSRLRSVSITLTAAVAITLGLHYVLDTVRAESAMRVAYGTPDESGARSPYATGPAVGRAPTDEVVAAIGPDPDQVVLSNRYDLYAFHGYWNFNQFTSQFAHPHAQYQARVKLIEQLALTRDPARMQQLLRTNPYDPIDALVLSRTKSGDLTYRYLKNDYPRGTVPVTITWERSAFADGRLFQVSDLRGWTVITVKPLAGQEQARPGIRRAS